MYQISIIIIFLKIDIEYVANKHHQDTIKDMKKQVVEVLKQYKKQPNLRIYDLRIYNEERK